MARPWAKKPKKEKIKVIAAAPSQKASSAAPPVRDAKSPGREPAGGAGAEPADDGDGHKKRPRSRQSIPDRR